MAKAASPGIGNSFAIQIDANDYLMVQRAIIGLGKRLPKATFNQMTTLAKFIQKSAKLRAPRFSGYLADSITASVSGKNRIQVSATAFYARFQEFGYEPHYVRIYRIYSRTGTRYAEIMRPRLYIWAMANLTYIPRVLFVKGFTPFMKPAAEAGIQKMSPMFTSSTMRAIRTEFARVKRPT